MQIDLITLPNVQIDPSVNFSSIINKNITYSRKFKISGYTFRNIQGVNLYMTQNSGNIVHLF